MYLIGTDKVLKMRSVNIENEIKSVCVKNVVNYGASTSKNFYDKGNSVKESERKNTDTKFSNTRDSDDKLLLEAANKIDANSMDVQVVTVYPGDIESWIDRFSEDIEFEDISQNNKTIGTGIEHAYHSNQSKTNSDCVKISRAKKVQSIFSENINVHRIENSNPCSINEFIKQNRNSIYDVFENAIRTHTAVKTSLDLVTTYEKIILSNNNVNTPVITQTFSISPFILTPSSSISEWVTTITHLLQKKSEEVETQGSGWVFRGVVFLDINTFKYDPLRGGCHFNLPKKLFRKNAIVNIKCREEDCFYWSVVASLFPVQSRNVDVTKPESYPHYNTVLNTRGLRIPLLLTDIRKFEEKNDISVNVYTYIGEKITGPLHLTRNKRSNHANLLYLDQKDKPFGHFCCISNLERLVSVQLSKHKSHKFLCDGCLLFFYSEAKLLTHQLENCMKVKTVLPKPPKHMVKFQNFHMQFPVEFVIYADFESILTPIATCDPQPDISYTNQINIHDPHSFSYHIKCSYDENLDRMEEYRGDNCVKMFISRLREDIIRISDIYSNPIPMEALSIQQQYNHHTATTCHICNGELRFHDKVMDHCHLTGKYRGTAHRDCNLKCSVPSFVPIILHNMQNYDSHFIITELGFSDDDEGIEVIAKTNEKYMCIKKTVKTTNNNRITIKFIDSLNFLPSSLE
ncbi:uncharacterized protein LOC126897236 isoform X3 [Daktulosphaira vitifoliae]|uniref:uncharacterized protein LOC126897236 isoform X3 n=2 Tax=Daktulosphaira vitifoliae TaxID=58002 RepID=UPI0021AAD519|nr:uncharacterized protein LOC126897236 isoform X3 [Daktulosphaira vitifoliae]